MNTNTNFLNTTIEFLSTKKYLITFYKAKKKVLKMGEAQAVNKIVVDLRQEKIDFINQTHAKEIEYWKNIAFDNKNEEERKQLTNLAPLKVSLYHKDSVKEVKNANEILCYLKNRYLPQMKSE